MALQQGLGEVGDVAPALMPWLLRLSHIRSGSFCSRLPPPSIAPATLEACLLTKASHACRAKVQGGDSNAALRDNARGILLWKVHYMLVTSCAAATHAATCWPVCHDHLSSLACCCVWIGCAGARPVAGR